MPTRPAYTGTERKLVLAFDVGTTYSGISYTILDPGREPETKSVTRFPGTAKVGGDAKVPTVIYYGPDGSPRAIGAETEREGIEELAEEANWVKAEWFKLHLQPRTLSTSSVSANIPPLPPNKTAVDVFADFLKYLNECAKMYIKERHTEGSSLLASGDVSYVLSHPNAWEGAQQSLMRKAAVQAGLVADATSAEQERISFITEGEASLNFCLDNGLMNESIKEGNGVIIVDAGGGTVDISTYARKPSSEHEFEEIAASQSHFKGSIFVTRAAGEYLDKFFVDSRFHDDVPFITKLFDKTTKLQFRDPNDPNYIKFGTVRDRDLNKGIRGGQLKLEGSLIAGFFEPSIQCIFEAVLAQEQVASTQKPISAVFLVGGFATSDHLYAQLQLRLKAHNIDVYRADAQLNKAVPDGAIVNFLRPSVRSRVAKFTYGKYCSLSLNGELKLPDAFSGILWKDTRVSETQEFRTSYHRYSEDKAELARRCVRIVCYRGRVPRPRFLDEDKGNFHEVFRIAADFSGPVDELEPRIGRDGITYYRLDYDVVIWFGLTEFKAQLVWKEKGVEKRGPAEILFDTEIHYES